MENTQLRAKILQNCDEKYRKFQQRLLPGTPILGVRLPVLRKIAKGICREEAKALLQDPPGAWFEERMVWAMVLGNTSLDPEDGIRLAERFLPAIDNWSVCDTAVSSFRFLSRDREHAFLWLRSLLDAEEPFIVRFGLVGLLWYCLNADLIDRTLSAVLSVSREEYYVQMAQAWALCSAYTAFPEKAEQAINSSALFPEVLSKTVRKINESLAVSKGRKLRAKTWLTANKKEK